MRTVFIATSCILVTIFGSVCYGNEAFVAQVGGANISFALPQAPTSNLPRFSDLHLTVPTASFKMGSLDSLFSAYRLPTAVAGTSLSSLTQDGNDNAGGSWQLGDGNIGLVSQVGDNNIGFVGQIGSMNAAAIYQNTSFGNATIQQHGSGNRAMIVQSR